MNRRTAQRGMTTVEFAIVGLLALIVLFSLIEISRAFFTVNALAEATRRGARVAAVCQVGDAAIAQIASFTRSGGSLIGDLGPQNFTVQYLDRDGLVIDPTAEPARYVRVSVQYPYRMLIPGFTPNFTMGPFTATVPAESLGVWRSGVSPC
jgi:hypothetical protein